jgi:hypothetical protein
MKKSVIKNKTLSKLQNCIQYIFNLSIEKTEYFTEFLDLFLINQNKKSNAIDIILIDKIYQTLNSVEMLHNDNKINFAKKTIKYNGNEFKYIKKITSGTYGDINNCVFNGKPSILKNIKFKQNELKNDDVVYFLNNEFLKENIIHLILFCLYESMLICTNNQIPRCIPEIHNIVNAVSKNDNGFETIVLIMEKLDFDLCYFFDKKHSFKEELSLISLVVYNIYNLQKCLKNFMHRDFHSKNIMLKKLNDLQSTTIITEDVKFDVYNNYQTYIIDFGMCFANFSSSKCKNINMSESKMFVEGSYQDNDTYNKGQDIRLFLASLYYWHNKTISEELNNFLKELFESYEKNSKFKSQIKNGTPTFFFYGDVLKIKDKRFYPENMLKRIRKIL